jgi:hypothetical protein
MLYGSVTGMAVARIFCHFRKYVNTNNHCIFKDFNYYYALFNAESIAKIVTIQAHEQTNTR